jgi:hypothetical protein
MKRTTTITNRARVPLRIFASKFTKLEIANKLALVFVILPKRGGFASLFKKTWALKLMPSH